MSRSLPSCWFAKTWTSTRPPALLDDLVRHALGALVIEVFGGPERPHLQDHLVLRPHHMRGGESG